MSSTRTQPNVYSYSSCTFGSVFRFHFLFSPFSVVTFITIGVSHRQSHRCKCCGINIYIFPHENKKALKLLVHLPGFEKVSFESFICKNFCSQKVYESNIQWYFLPQI